MDRGAEINAADNEGNSVLGLAIQSALKDIVIMLLDKGADINKVNKYGKNPLMLAVEFKFKFDLHKHHILNSEKQMENDWCREIITILLDRGAEINAADNDGDTTLGLAIKSEIENAVIILIDRGADINKANKDGKTPLMLAVELKFKVKLRKHHILNSQIKIKNERCREIITILMDKGADINAADNDGNTVLVLAIQSRLKDVVIMLLDKGADINKVNKYGKTPLMLAVEFESESDTNPTDCISILEITEIIEAILERGAEIITADNAENTVL